jgi:PIN domain nuclease of toxin-antitoxin system
MDFLLDTHVLLWWDRQDSQLGNAAKAAIRDPKNSVFVSAASIWEIAIKARKGKLAFEGSPCELIEANGFTSLPIRPEHGEMAGALDWGHVDPFDRVLVAQAKTENFVLVHADSVIRGFGEVSQLWAR